jgi:hypothetical protein
VSNHHGAGLRHNVEPSGGFYLPCSLYQSQRLSWVIGSHHTGNESELCNLLHFAVESSIVSEESFGKIESSEITINSAKLSQVGWVNLFKAGKALTATMHRVLHQRENIEARAYLLLIDFHKDVDHFL